MTDQRVAVIGAGTMGAGIAITSLLGGNEVTMIDVDDERTKRGREQVTAFIDRSLKLGKIDQARHEAALANLTTATDLAAAERAQFVVEAVFEDLGVKQELLARLDQVCSDDALFHTNTSTLSVTAIAAGSSRPERVVGTHYCNPAPLMSLVEVVRGSRTSDAALAATNEFVAGINKVAIEAPDTPGFIVNRFLVPFENDCIRALEAGRADVPTIDKAVRLALKYPMGPFTLLDTVGLDIHEAVSRSLYEQLKDPRFSPPPLVYRMIGAGDLGRKTGRGFYTYDDRQIFGA